MFNLLVIFDEVLVLFRCFKLSVLVDILFITLRVAMFFKIFEICSADGCDVIFEVMELELDLVCLWFVKFWMFCMCFGVNVLGIVGELVLFVMVFDTIDIVSIESECNKFGEVWINVFFFGVLGVKYMYIIEILFELFFFKVFVVSFFVVIVGLLCWRRFVRATSTAFCELNMFYKLLYVRIKNLLFFVKCVFFIFGLMVIGLVLFLCFLRFLMC